MSVLERLQAIWPWLIAVGSLLLTAIAAGHAVLHKRDVRAAIGWAGLIVLSPFVGAALYYLFGINRIRRRASALAVRRREREIDEERPEIAERFGPGIDRLRRAVGQVTGARLLPGNDVEVFVDGDAAYPAILEAIGQARRSVLLETYIFDDDQVGKLFVDALAAAVERGVEVRVLVDGVGMRYSDNPITRLLEDRGVRCALFLPSRIPFLKPYMNLRNHRKLLIVDGSVGFTGGMNVRADHMLSTDPPTPTRDVHFRLRGPIVERMFEAANEDWLFTTQEKLEGPAWEIDRSPVGDVLARGIPDGPDEQLDVARWTLLSALGAAERRVRIATPYFIPDRVIVAALRLAVLRGVEVQILVPERSNLHFVQWAMTAQLRHVVEHGCDVWLMPAPFDHTKLMIVDDAWSLIGSANWDERSLRLNFEYNVECYSEPLAGELNSILDTRLAGARKLTVDALAERSLPIRLRDGLSRLFAPYL